MSVLNPIKIDRYLLYLDQVVFITFDDQDISLYKVVFSDGDKITLPRNCKAELNTLLPSTFLRYEEMWINDLFVKYMDSRWDEASKRQKLITKFTTTSFNSTTEYSGDKVRPLTRDVKIIDIDNTEEVGTSQEITAKINARQQVSITSLFTTESEVQQKVAQTTAPISAANQNLSKRVTSVEKTIGIDTEDGENQTEIRDMGEYFNSLIGANSNDY